MIKNRHPSGLSSLQAAFADLIQEADRALYRASRICARTRSLTRKISSLRSELQSLTFEPAIEEDKDLFSEDVHAERFRERRAEQKRQQQKQKGVTTYGEEELT